nr:uncharacterized protein LOC112544265 [Pelodiscus sinensis]|eukprot:XP_025035938.1 uncharacterized protein LOC112544265 [Pelodiscus sinensis]
MDNTAARSFISTSSGGARSPPPLQRGPVTLAPVYEARYHATGGIPPGVQESASRHAEQILWSPQVVAQGLCSASGFPQVGLSPPRPVRLGTQCQVPELLFPSGTGEIFPGGCPDGCVSRGHSLCFSPVSPNFQGVDQSEDFLVHDHSHSPQVAQAILVPHSSGHAYPRPNSAPSSLGPANSYLGRGDHGSPGSQVSPPNGLVYPWLNQPERECSQEVQMVLLSSRKPSTTWSYAAKWRRFSSWASRRGVHPPLAPIPAILDYLFQLRSSGLSFSSIKVHVASLSAFHAGTAGVSLFSNQGAGVLGSFWCSGTNHGNLQGGHMVFPPHVYGALCASTAGQGGCKCGLCSPRICNVNMFCCYCC